MSAMLPTDSRSPSRRALLAGALGGLGALAAGAIGRATPVRAADGDPVVQGSEANNASSRTTVTNTTSANFGDALKAVAFSNGRAITGVATTGIAMYGQSNTGFGVFGSCDSGKGVQGASNSAEGVLGVSDTNTGVRGESSDYVGLYGDSDNHNGVVGNNRSLNHAAVIGYSEVDGTGVEGVSGGGVAIPGKPKTGVYGEAAQDSNAKGVWGHSPTGRGIQGSTTSGYAGYFSGKVFSTKFYELVEIANPSAAPANRARLFVRDNGSGKTQLCVRFQTGTVRVLATEA